MPCVDYELKLYDQFGNFLKFIIDYEQFELNRIKNDIGTLNIVLPAVTHSINDFLADYRLEVFRKGNLVGNTCWFLQRKSLNLQDSKEVVTLTFADSMDILSRRINAWYACDIPPCFGALQDLADDAIKTVVQANFGTMVDPPTDPVSAPLASPNTSGVIVHQGVPPAVSIAYTFLYTNGLNARPMPFQVEAYRSAGVLITQEVSFVDVLTALQDIANASLAIPLDSLQHNVWFDIVYVPATPSIPASFEFKTWVGVRGNDYRNFKYIGPTHGNLINSTFTEDYSTKGDIAYVLGDGDATGQLVGVAYLDKVSNSYYYTLPFGPTEVVTEFSQENADDVLLEGEGLSYLGDLNKTKSLEGEIINTPSFDFITDYNFGDILTLNWGEVNEIIEINEFTVAVDSSGIESVTVPLTIL